MKHEPTGLLIGDFVESSESNLHFYVNRFIDDDTIECCVVNMGARRGDRVDLPAKSLKKIQPPSLNWVRAKLPDEIKLPPLK